MKESNFILPEYPITLEAGKIEWKAPSNIALIKYWGKKGLQIPANPSLSFTLQKSLTSTSLSYSPIEKSENFSFEVFFDGKPNPDFKPKIEDFLSRVDPYLPFLKKFHFKIETTNTFPHSSGIASSASGFAALALCFAELERIMNTGIDPELFLKKASFMARLGSGSASRSIQGPLMLWGDHGMFEGSSDLYAIVYPFEVHPVFRSFHDTILLVDRGRKSVSSSTGHQLMVGHRYAGKRFDQATDNLTDMKAILKNGDLNRFVEIVESEALSLHAMMMTSIPYYLLMQPNTVAIIQKIWEFRLRTGLHLCFTLDAGANVHLLFPDNESAEVYDFIQEELLEHCDQGGLIKDRVGLGAVMVS